MKIAVTSGGGSMSAQVDQNFGRCAYFIIYDTETGKFEPVTNPAASMMGGAGPAAAKLISEKNCGILLTGMIGPNAEQALTLYGIKVVTGVSGTVKEAVDSYLKQTG